MNTLNDDCIRHVVERLSNDELLCFGCTNVRFCSIVGEYLQSNMNEEIFVSLNIDAAYVNEVNDKFGDNIRNIQFIKSISYHDEYDGYFGVGDLGIFLNEIIEAYKVAATKIMEYWRNNVFTIARNVTLKVYLNLIPSILDDIMDMLVICDNQIDLFNEHLFMILQRGNMEYSIEYQAIVAQMSLLLKITV